MTREGEHLDRLLTLGAELVRLCEAIRIQPIVYGSLAYLAHTDDASCGIHDIDFVVPAADRVRVAVLLRPDRSLVIEPTSYNSTKVFRGDLKVSFDDSESYLGGIPFTAVPKVVAGRSFTVIDERSLGEAYARGAASIPEKREAYATKLQRLKDHRAGSL